MPYDRSLLPYDRSLFFSFFFGAQFSDDRVVSVSRSLLPHDRSLLPYDRSLLPYTRSLLPYDRSLLSYDRSLLSYDRSLLPYDRSLLPCDGSLLTFWHTCPLGTARPHRRHRHQHADAIHTASPFCAARARGQQGG